MMTALAAAAASVVPIGLTNFLTEATCLLSLFFGISYTVMRRWWKYQMGWNLFTLRTSLGLVLLPYTLHLLLGVRYDSPFYQWFTTVIFVLVPLAVLHSIYMLFLPALEGPLKRMGLIPDKGLPAAEDDIRQPPSNPVP